MNEFILHELVGTLTVGVVALAVLALADALKRTTSLPYELTRKVAHIGSGLAVLLIPVFISSSWTVLVLTSGFALLMFSTHVFGLLQGVHGVGRGVGGVLWYPVTAWLLFFIVFDVRGGTYLEYAIPVLVLACADAMGAVIGRSWGRHKYEVITGHYRSVEGSTAFFITALACIALPLTIGMDVPVLHALSVAALVSLIAMAFEAVSVHGLDNLLVPMGTLLFLERFLPLDGRQLAMHALVLVAVTSCALVIGWRRPATGGGIASFVLSCYTVLLLGGWLWLPPLAGLIAVFAVWERLAPVASDLVKTRYELGTAMIGLTVPVLLVLLYATTDDTAIRHAIYVGYLASIACQAAVLFYVLPQHRSFRLRRLRRLITTRDPWQHGPTAGKALFAALGVTLALTGPMLLMDATAVTVSRSSLSVLLTLACMAGLAAFVTLASTTCARRSCPACGNVTLHGMGCCHTYSLGIGDTVSLRTMTFRKTYLAANTIAAVAATAVVITWTS
ncbi:MAG: hypothetical protein ABI200_03500 [Gaiellales bacterium]